MGRDRKVLILFLLMPLMLIGILGVSLKEAMTLGKIEPFAVILVNADQPAQMGGMVSIHLGQVLADEAFGSERAKEIITLSTSTDLAAARQQVADGRAVAVVHVPGSFSADILGGKRAAIQLFTDPAHPTQVDILEQIVGSFTDQVTANAVAVALMGPGQVDGRIDLPTILERQSGNRQVGAMSYYAAGMAVMYMLMSAVQRAKTILQDRESGVLARVMISPTPTWVVLAGQSLSTAVLIAIQFLLLLLGSTLLYGVDWGPWLPVMLIGLAFAVAAAGLSTGMAAIFRDPKAADAGVGLLGMVFGALSGSMFPLWMFPDALMNIARFVPNYWALQGFLDQMAGLGLSYAWLPVSILCIIGLTTGALGAWRLATR